MFTFEPRFNLYSISSAFSFQATAVISPVSSAILNLKTLPGVWSLLLKFEDGKTEVAIPSILRFFWSKVIWLIFVMNLLIDGCLHVRFED